MNTPFLDRRSAILMIILGVFAFALPFPAAAQKPTSAASLPAAKSNSQAAECGIIYGIVLYEHANYTGECRGINWHGGTEFAYDTFNDKASSIRFVGEARGRLQVALYEHQGLTGVASVIRYDDPDLGDNAIGHDRTTSIFIRPSCLASWANGFGVVLYEHADYKGACVAFTGPGQVPNLTTYNFNDKASSIELAGAWIVTLYEHQNLTGTSTKIFSPGDQNLGDNPINHDRTTSLYLRYD